MSLDSTILMALIGTIIAIGTGYAKEAVKKDPEAFNYDKVLRTVIAMVLYIFFKVLAESYGLALDVDILVGGFIDSGLIAIWERILLALWRKFVPQT